MWRRGMALAMLCGLAQPSAAAIVCGSVPHPAAEAAPKASAQIGRFVVRQFDHVTKPKKVSAMQLKQDGATFLGGKLISGCSPQLSPFHPQLVQEFDIQRADGRAFSMSAKKMNALLSAFCSQFSKGLLPSDSTQTRARFRRSKSQLVQGTCK